jgi:hypothetical protein
MKIVQTNNYVIGGRLTFTTKEKITRDFISDCIAESLRFGKPTKFIISRKLALDMTHFTVPDKDLPIDSFIWQGMLFVVVDDDVLEIEFTTC